MMWRAVIKTGSISSIRVYMKAIKSIDKKAKNKTKEE
jgi:hypothetical protein